MDLEDYHAYRMAKNLRAVYPPLLIIIGLTGNILSLRILAQQKHRNTSTGAMLILLTLTDSVILIFVVFEKWLKYVFDSDLRNSSNFWCKVHVFFTYFLLQMSPWILVILTSERICSVLYLDKVRRIFTRRNVLILALVCAVFLTCLNSHLLYGCTLTFDVRFNTSVCGTAENHKKFMSKAWPWIDFLFAFAIPFCFLLCGNVIVLRKLKVSYRFRKASFSLLQRVKNKSIGLTRNVSKQESSIGKRVSYFTKVAFVINVAFVFLVSPFVIFAIGESYWFPEESRTTEQSAQLILTVTVLHFLMYTHNVINFIVYILCGTTFREDLISFVMCKRFTVSSRNTSSRDRSTSHSFNTKVHSTDKIEMV